MVDPDDAHVLGLRVAEELSFRAIGARLDLSEEAARKRVTRATVRLGLAYRKLERGELDELEDDGPAAT